MLGLAIASLPSVAQAHQLGAKWGPQEVDFLLKLLADSIAFLGPVIPLAIYLKRRSI